MNDILTIIIPIYNGEPNLAKCLESVANQTYKNIEVILVDDGSTDNSYKICVDYSKKYNWTVIRTQNFGVANARNIALEKASGKYILFIDSDDYISENYAISLYDMVKNGKCDIAFSKVVEVNNGIFTKVNEPFVAESIIDLKSEFDYGKSCMLRHSACSIISRELIGNTRQDKDIYVGEDSLFMSQIIIKSNYKVGYTEKSTYYYVIYDVSGNHGPINSKKMSVINAWEMIIENYKKKAESLVPGCYLSLFNEIESIIYRLVIFGPFNKEYLKECVNTLKKNYKTMLRYNFPIKTIVKYTWLMLSPNSYAHTLKLVKILYRE